MVRRWQDGGRHRAYSDSVDQHRELPYPQRDRQDQRLQQSRRGRHRSQPWAVLSATSPPRIKPCRISPLKLVVVCAEQIHS